MENHIPNLNFQKNWKNTYKSYRQIIAYETLTLNATTVDNQKITYTYSYNALE